jgi:hypothetical protein
LALDDEEPTMSTKESMHSNTKAAVTKQVPRPRVPEQSDLVDQELPLSAVVQRAGRGSTDLSPNDVLSLQRLAGNRAVSQLLTGRAPRPAGRPAVPAPAPTQGPTIQRMVIAFHRDMNSDGMALADQEGQQFFDSTAAQKLISGDKTFMEMFPQTVEAMGPDEPLYVLDHGSAALGNLKPTQMVTGSPENLAALIRKHFPKLKKVMNLSCVSGYSIKGRETYNQALKKGLSGVQVLGTTGYSSGVLGQESFRNTDRLDSMGYNLDAIATSLGDRLQALQGTIPEQERANKSKEVYHLAADWVDIAKTVGPQLLERYNAKEGFQDMLTEGIQQANKLVSTLKPAFAFMAPKTISPTFAGSGAKISAVYDISALLGGKAKTHTATRKRDESVDTMV